MALSTRLTSGFTRYGGLAAVPTLVGLLGYPPLFLGIAPVVFPAFGRLVSRPLVFLALFGCPFSSGLLGRFLICGYVLYDRFLGRSTLGRAFFFTACLGDARADRVLRGRGNVWWRVILLENSAGKGDGGEGPCSDCSAPLTVIPVGVRIEAVNTMPNTD